MPLLTEKRDVAETMTFQYSIDRYYYTSQRRFEQSIDVYKPMNKTTSSGTSEKERSSKIPVVLVMGSGWLGHKAYFYIMTHWWNSSAPKQICGKLGHPCVSIRHSGGYLFGRKDREKPMFLRWLFLTPILAVAVATAFAAEWSVNLRFPSFGTIIIIFPLLLLTLYLEGMGAAGIDDMVSDVSDALSYIDDHAHEWGLGGVAEMENDMNQKTVPIVFGGYSSGAHVAATLLMASHLSPLSSSKSLSMDGTQRLSVSSKGDSSKLAQSQPQQLKYLTIRSILYISGVLDVSPESFVMTLLSRVVLRKSPLEVPSPLRTLTSSSSLSSNTNATSNGSHEHIDCFPPHVLIGCKHEVFGWSILDSAFCAREYADALRSLLSCKSQSPSKGTTDKIGDDDDKKSFVRLILLKDWTVNHWSILSSAALRNALRNVLSSLDYYPEIDTTSCNSEKLS